jgi:hypothetical protein
MTYRLELEIPGLPKTTNSLRGGGHWARYTHDQKWKEIVAAKVIGKKPTSPLTKYRLSLTRFSSVEPDFDGVVSSFKVIVDALREAGVIANDKISMTGQWNCSWEKCKPKQGKMRVIVEESCTS